MNYLRPLPLGIQTFSKIIERNCVYVDKTEQIHKLIKQGQAYFLSRPRRFGKSLLISTLEEIFLGRKELFKGLWIYNSDYEWKKHPVIRIDFSEIKPTSVEQLIDSLNVILNNIANQNGVELKTEQYYNTFKELIQKLSEKGKVVILIDEYDKLIIDNITNVELASEFREILKGFYTVIKANDAHIRFVFLTGVSKFSKMSVFSGLNNLTDLTMDNRYATLTGITTEEIEIYFKDYIEELTKKLSLSKKELLKKIVTWYNGYRFSDSEEKVINPYSFLSFLYSQKLKNFWFETGTPTFLIKLLQEKNYDLNNVVGRKIGSAAFSSYEIGNLDIMPLLLQTGYLTIKEYYPERDLYMVDLPNYEVEHSFYEFLLEDYAHIDAGTSKSFIYDMVDAVNAGDIDGFMNILKVFYANIPYDIQIKNEKYYQSMFFALFKLIGLQVDTEVKTSEGRIDAVVETHCNTSGDKKNIYIFEFKINGTAQEALEQIKERGYYEKYMGSEKRKVKSEKLKVKSEKLDGALLSEKLKVKNEKDTLASDSSFKKRENKENVAGDNHRNQDDRKGRPYRVGNNDHCSLQPTNCNLQPETDNLQPATYHLFLIGIGFDMKEKKVKEYLWEKI